MRNHRIRQRSLPAWLQRGIDRSERERKAAVIARPMRNLFDGLARGEAYESDGRVIMVMSEIDKRFACRMTFAFLAAGPPGQKDSARLASTCVICSSRTLIKAFSMTTVCTSSPVEMCCEMGIGGSDGHSRVGCPGLRVHRCSGVRAGCCRREQADRAG